MSQRESRIELDESNGFRGYTDKIIDVPLGQIFSALVVEITSAGDASIERTGERWNPCHEKVHHPPDNSLGRQSSRPISKRQGAIQENLSLPENSKENGSNRIEKKPPIPAREINLEDKNSLAGILGTSALDGVLGPPKVGLAVNNYAGTPLLSHCEATAQSTDFLVPPLELRPSSSPCSSYS